MKVQLFIDDKEVDLTPIALDLLDFGKDAIAANKRRKVQRAARRRAQAREQEAS